jgi:hypothetical protein
MREEFIFFQYCISLLCIQVYVAIARQSKSHATVSLESKETRKEEDWKLRLIRNLIILSWEKVSFAVAGGGQLVHGSVANFLSVLNFISFSRIFPHYFWRQ